MEIRLRDILREKGMSANAFAAKMGMAPSGLPLNGTFAPTVEKLQTIAAHLQVATWELFYDCHQPLAPCKEEPDQRIVVQNRVNELLRSKGLSKTETARRMGVSLPSFTLTIKNNMSTKTIEKLCASIGADPWELFISRIDLEHEIAERSGRAAANEPEPTPAVDTAQSAKAGRYVAIPLLPNGSPDLSKLEWIDTPEGRLLVWPMSEVRIIELGADEAVPEPEEEAEVLQLTGDR